MAREESGFPAVEKFGLEDEVEESGFSGVEKGSWGGLVNGYGSHDF